MHVLLFLAGVIAAGAGLVTMAYGFVNPAFRVTEATLISASLGAVGGLLMIGLGSALLHLRRIGDALEMRPVAHDVSAMPPGLLVRPAGDPPVSNPPMTLPAPILQRSAEMSAAGSPPAPVDETAVSAMGEETVAPAVHSPPMRPAMTAPAAAVAAALDLAPSAEAADSAAAPPERRILKSGVIEGMAYSLYSDGSVDAELTEGQRHFESISAWRAHMREIA